MPLLSFSSTKSPLSNYLELLNIVPIFFPVHICSYVHKANLKHGFHSGKLPEPFCYGLLLG